jgi:hypothetical protein
MKSRARMERIAMRRKNPMATNKAMESTVISMMVGSSSIFMEIVLSGEGGAEDEPPAACPIADKQ